MLVASHPRLGDLAPAAALYPIPQNSVLAYTGGDPARITGDGGLPALTIPIGAQAPSSPSLSGLLGLAGLFGLGDASCPSMEQLEGIIDLNDPCQSATAPGNTVVLPATSTLTGPLTPAVTAALAAGQTTLAPTCMPGDTLQQVNGAYSCVPGTSTPLNPWMIGGLVALVAVVFLGGRR